ncbi:conserved hypothetical protein [Histoplasma mississippiense (nom. inval.)]|uniref:conserved hypothetical protein n=1 Tax=Ajellomyces capsulatus (strain NAm1 / WU24) TaxID=2059318 RepID=UPI000157BE4F|nr:conserved hypothetical protein [Histoplasma mississippiense (nom. inval.)]EDN06450.1 conserved hypothetical protein [Histoplasma mississippiense (nom. inval.)]
MAGRGSSSHPYSQPSPSASSTPRNILQHEANDNDLRRRWAAEISTRNYPVTGAPNSLDNFARSWQRAAYFPEVAPRRSSFVLALPGDEEHGPDASVDDTTALLRQRSAPVERISEIPFSEADYWPNYGTRQETTYGRPLTDGEFDESTRTTPLLGRSYEESYLTTVSSRISESARLNAAQLHREHQLLEAGAVVAAESDDEREPFVVKRIQHEDGSKETIIVGQSTVPQTIFNSVNVLIGIGLLSLPLGLMYAGWFIGILLLIFSAVSTTYTAKILAKCMDVDPTLVTYADLAYISFGPHARIVTSLLFCLELMGACVALVVLFADSIDALFPGLGALRWKLICGAILIPMNFVPLRLLSLSSILGILCCTSIVLIIFIDGIIKTESPGSLRDPARTSLLPDNWSAVPLSFGLIMYLAMAVAGWLMFGPDVRDEITSNILLTAGYPNWLSVCIVAFIAIIPLTKVPLSTVESLCGLHPPPPNPNRKNKLRNTSKQGSSALLRKTVQFTARIVTICIITFIAIVFPYFDRIMALIGASLCITICIILPVAFYLKIFGRSILFWERVVDWVLLGVGSVMAVVGTAWAFIPKENLGLR